MDTLVIILLSLVVVPIEGEENQRTPVTRRRKLVKKVFDALSSAIKASATNSMSARLPAYGRQTGFQ